MVGFFKLWSEQQGGGFPIYDHIYKYCTDHGLYYWTFDCIRYNKYIYCSNAYGSRSRGLAVSLALKDTLTDVFAGLHILLSKKVEPGDFVSLDSGEMGYIQNITWRNTKMLERSNNVIHIPNTKLSSAIIKNYDETQVFCEEYLWSSV